MTHNWAWRTPPARWSTLAPSLLVVDLDERERVRRYMVHRVSRLL